MNMQSVHCQPQGFEVLSLDELLHLIADDIKDNKVWVTSFRWRLIELEYDDETEEWKAYAEINPHRLQSLYYLIGLFFDREAYPAYRSLKEDVSAIGLEFEVIVSGNRRIVISSEIGIHAIFGASQRPPISGGLITTPTPPSRLLESMRYQIQQQEIETLTMDIVSAV